MVDLNIQPSSDFDVDFGFARRFYSGFPLSNWSELESHALAAGKLIRDSGEWDEIVDTDHTALDTHGIVADGARIAGIEGQAWSTAPSSVLVACHYGLAYAEVSLALHRANAAASMRPWSRETQDFQSAMKVFTMQAIEQTASAFEQRRQLKLPLPPANVLMEILKQDRSLSGKHRAAVPLMMNERQAWNLKPGIGPRWPRSTPTP